MSERIRKILKTKGLDENNVEMVRLNYGWRLYINKELNKPVLFTAANGENFIDEVLSVERFYRPLVSRMFGTRRCSGALRIRSIDGTSAPRTFYFINAHPLFGYRHSFESEADLWNTDWDHMSFLEKINSGR